MTNAYFRRLPKAAFIMAAAVSLNVVAAPPQVTHLFPAGCQAGGSATFTASGTIGNWPTGVWCSRSDVSITPEKDKGKLTAQAPADATPGVAWVRLFNDEGSSAQRPFVIGTLPEVNEQEPNDDPTKPQRLSSSHGVVNGQLGKSGDVDTFAVALAKGQTLVAALTANRILGSPMDGVLQIVSSSGFVLAQNDDDHGLDPQIAFTAPSDGSYLVRLFGFPATPNSSVTLAGAETFVYRLTLATAGFADFTWPLALSRGKPNEVKLCGWGIPEAAELRSLTPGQSEASLIAYHRQIAGFHLLPVVDFDSLSEPAGDSRPIALPVPCAMTGRIARPAEIDTYAFEGTKGQRVQVRVDARELGLPLDATVKVLDAAGKTVAQADDQRDSRDPELAVSIPADGTYRVQIADLHRQGGPRYVYRLSIVPVQPDFSLKLAADNFVLPAGKPLEIPITIDRSNGFAEEIEVTAAGLPEGVVAAPVKSAGKGDTAKQVKLSLTSTTGPHGVPIQIVASVGEKWRAASFPLPGLGASTEQFWLTVAKP